MLRIAFSTLRARKGGMLGAWAAVALAAVLVASCGILLESSLRAPIPVERLDAAAVVVQADHTLQPQGGRGNVSLLLPEQTRLPASLAGQLTAIPGVRAAVADRTFPAEIVDGRGRLVTAADGTVPVGHGWSSATLTPLALTSGRSPARDDEAVLDAGLASPAHLHVGDRVRIATATTRRSFTVVGIAAPSRAHGPSDRPAVYFGDDVAVRLSGNGQRADLIAILTKPGADASAVAQHVRDALDRPGLRVLTGAKRGEAESLESTLSREDIVAGLTSFGVFAAFVAIFVVASTFAFSVQQRHRELALFRAIGSTPRQVRRMVAGEAFVISLLAVAAAVPLSVLFAFGERSLFARVHMLPADLEIVVGWMPFAGALVVAVVTTQLAAFASARRASRIRPIDALRESAVQRRPVSWLRGLAGLAVLAAGGAVLVAANGGGQDAPAAAMIWMVAAALLGPLLALPFVWLLGLPLRAFGRGPGLLASANSRANLRRVASVATPMMLTVSLGCTILFARTTADHQASAEATKSMTARHVLRSGEGAGLTPDVVAAARRAPGVAHASATFATSVAIADGGGNLALFPARAVDAATLAGVVDLGFTAGSLRDLHGASLAVGKDTADEHGWHVGDRVRIWLGDGTPARLRVAGIYERPLGFGDVVLPAPVLRGHVTDMLADAVLVSREPGVDERELETALGTLTRARPGVEVVTRSRYLDDLRAAAREESLAIYLLFGIIVLFSAVAVVNALTMAIAERGRELALLRLVGATRRQLTRMIRAETLIVAVFGTTLGTLIAAPALAVFSYGLTGSAVPAVSLWLFGGVLAGCALLALAASVVPTRLALRMNPVAAMGARE